LKEIPIKTGELKTIEEKLINVNKEITEME
jgi:hypothetical protein